jgi:hypothetical protein
MTARQREEEEEERMIEKEDAIQLGIAENKI